MQSIGISTKGHFRTWQLIDWLWPSSLHPLVWCFYGVLAQGQAQGVRTAVLSEVTDHAKCLWWALERARGAVPSEHAGEDAKCQSERTSNFGQELTVLAKVEGFFLAKREAVKLDSCFPLFYLSVPSLFLLCILPLSCLLPLFPCLFQGGSCLSIHCHLGSVLLLWLAHFIMSQPLHPPHRSLSLRTTVSVSTLSHAIA